MTEVSGGNELQRDQTLLAGKKSGHTGNEAGRLEEKKSKKKKACGSKNVKKQSKRENNLKLTKGHTEGGTHASDGQSEIERERYYLQRNIDKTFFYNFKTQGSVHQETGRARAQKTSQRSHRMITFSGFVL